jgi:hypothetical protein
MSLRRSRSRLLAGLAGLAVLPWTIHFEQARIKLLMQSVMADVRHSLNVHAGRPKTRSPSTAASRHDRELVP